MTAARPARSAVGSRVRVTLSTIGAPRRATRAGDNTWQPIAARRTPPEDPPCRRPLRSSSHPDRLLPADPGVRAVARRLYDAVRDLPIISPHGHVDPRAAARRRAVPRPGVAAGDARPLRHPAAARRRACRWPRSASAAAADRGASRAQVWRLLCAHWHVFRGTPSRYWLEAELAEIFDVTVRPSAADRRRDLRPGRRAAGRRTPTAPGRCSSGSASRCWPPPTTRATTSPRTPRWPPTRLGRAGCCPTFRPDRYLEPAAPGWAGAVARARRGQRRRHRQLRRLGARAWRTRRAHFLAHGAVSADHSHDDVGTEPLEPARPSASTARRWPARRRPAEAVALRRHMLLEMARMSCDDGLVMTLHPGVRRNHHGPTPRRVRPGHRPRHPAARSSSPTRCARCWSASARTRACTWCCSPSTRRCSPASSRRWPASTRRCTSGAPWWFLDAPEAIRRFRARGHRDRRLLPHVGVHRRHPRVLLDPGPARHVPPPRRRLPRPAGRRAPARRGRGAGDDRSTWSPAGRARCSSCDRPLRRDGAAAPPGARSCTSGSATSSAPTRPGTPTAPPTPPSGASPPSPAAAATLADALARPGRPLHAGHPRRRRRRVRGGAARSRAPTPPTTTTPGWATWPRPTCAW